MADVVIGGWSYTSDNLIYADVRGTSTGATQVQCIAPVPDWGPNVVWRVNTTSCFQDSGGALTCYFAFNYYSDVDGIHTPITVDTKSFTHNVPDSFDWVSGLIIPSGYSVAAYTTFAIAGKQLRFTISLEPIDKSSVPRRKVV